jgi:TonB family protein
VPPVPRRYAIAQIGDARFEMHLDLGAAVSQLRESSWNKAKLAAVAVKLRLVDEAATPREVTRAGIASGVTLGATKTSHVTFVPYIERRFATAELDGALGLDFFRPYAVYANWDNQTYYLKPRGDAAATTTARLGRWGAAVPICPHPGCVTAELVAGAGAGGVALHVTRDAQAADHGLEVVLGVTPAAGKSTAPLIVELPRDADQVTTALPADYAGATVAVADVSPFPRTCVGEGGCVLPLGGIVVSSAEPESRVAPPAGSSPVGSAPSSSPPTGSPPTGSPPTGSPPTGSPPTRNVVIEKLHRLTGEPAIPPSDDVQRAAAGKPFAVAIVKVCLTADGKVDSTKIVKSSGMPAYDEQLQATIKATWAFTPVETEGKPGPVCTSVTFVAR